MNGIQQSVAVAQDRAGGQVIDLIQRYDGSLRKFLFMHTPDDADPDDILQEVYLRLVRRDDLSAITFPRAFVFRTALNLLRDRARRKISHAQDRHVSIDSIDVESSQPSPEALVSHRQSVNIIEFALSRLKPKCRLAFERHRFDGRTYGEIAEELGISVSMVQKHISKALDCIRYELDRRA